MEDQATETPDSAELTLVYIAKKLKEALALEELFTATGVEYFVEPDTYRGGIIFATERIGAFFYVHPGDVEAAHTVLVKNSYKPYSTG